MWGFFFARNILSAQRGGNGINKRESVSHYTIPKHSISQEIELSQILYIEKRAIAAQ